MTTVAAVSGDHRRACALTLHVIRNDEQGAHAVLTEALESGRWAQLCYSLALLTLTLVPELETEEAQRHLATAGAMFAAGEQATG